jgi:hypothetical protein
VKITKEELTNIIKEEIEKALEEQEEVPKERPPLPKNWRELPFTDSRRVAYQKWYMVPDPSAKKQQQSQFQKEKSCPM